MQCFPLKQAIIGSLSLQVFYETQDEAVRDVKRGEIIGYIEFAHNFSQSFVPFNDAAAKDPSHNGFIQVQLDHSELQKMGFVKQMIYENFLKVMKKLMKECGKSSNAFGSPLNVEPMYRKLDFDFSHSLIPSCLLGYILSFHFPSQFSNSF